MCQILAVRGQIHKMENREQGTTLIYTNAPIAFFMQKLIGLFQKQSTKPMNLIFCNLFAIKTEQRLYSSKYN